MKDKLFKDVLPRVSKPARYTGGEVNMIKKDWNQSSIKMVFAFPDIYEIGMSHLGGKILYGLINEQSNHLMERTFAPWPDMEQIMRAEKIPLYSLESFSPVKNFDVIGFSLQYEMSITNILNMLDLAGIPVWAKNRDDSWPLIIAGGPVVFNPEPFADFFDAFLIGDAEDMLLEFLDFLANNKHLSRQERLIQLAEIEGVYVPALYSVEYNEDETFKSLKPRFKGVKLEVRKRLVKDLDKVYFPEKPVLPYIDIIHDRAVLEVMRGCQRGCRFCHAGIVYRPVRERSIDTLKKQADMQVKNSGYEEISLASLSTLDYSGVKTLVTELVEEYEKKGVGVSLPSLRVDAFSIEVANEVQKVRKTTLTLAPEAGTQRLRNIINKNVSEEQLFNAVEAAFKSGWLSIKLYFMFGLPGETTADLDGIIELLKKVKSIGDQNAPRTVEVRASLACFVPKAHTPFQWQAQNSIEELELKRKHLFEQKKKRIVLKFHDSRTSYLEGVLARGDRRLSPAIYLAWQKGCKFDGWSEYFCFERWMEALEQCNINPDFYTRRLRAYNERFPWDFINTGVTKEYLQRENERAVKEIITPDCRQNGCTGCGVCTAFDLDLNIKEENHRALKS
jgi:radical SAM family uncharacterized protein